MITALNDTLFFGFYSALTSQGGLVVTVACEQIETPSGLSLARRHAWCSIWLIREPSNHSASEQAIGPSQSPLPKE